MPYLFIIAILAFAAYCNPVFFSDEDNLPGAGTWLSVLVMGLAWTAFGAGFLLPGPWEPYFEISPEMGAWNLLIIVIDLFILIGPYGNALLWGALGLWCLKKVVDGGWYRDAMLHIELAKKEAAEAKAGQIKYEAEERRKQADLDWKRSVRCARFERWGAAAGRAVSNLVGWR